MCMLRKVFLSVLDPPLQLPCSNCHQSSHMSISSTPITVTIQLVLLTKHPVQHLSQPLTVYLAQSKWLTVLDQNCSLESWDETKITYPDCQSGDKNSNLTNNIGHMVLFYLLGSSVRR